MTATSRVLWRCDACGRSEFSPYDLSVSGHEAVPFDLDGDPTAYPCQGKFRRVTVSDLLPPDPRGGIYEGNGQGENLGGEEGRQHDAEPEPEAGEEAAQGTGDSPGSRGQKGRRLDDEEVSLDPGENAAVTGEREGTRCLLTDSGAQFRVMMDVVMERRRQTAKWGDQWEPGATGPLKKLAISTEEALEVAQEAIGMALNVSRMVQEPHVPAELYEELVQNAAVYAAWAESIVGARREGASRVRG